MSKTIQALKIQKEISLQKVEAEINEVQQQYDAIEHELNNLQQRLSLKESQKLAIIPELEISRMNFSIHSQQRLAALKRQMKELDHQAERLKQKKQRIRTELRHIELYEEKKQRDATEKTQQQQWIELDHSALSHDRDTLF